MVRILFFIAVFSIMSSFSFSQNDTLHYILFFNGNRGPKFNKYTTDNQLHEKDWTGYWYQYDDEILKRCPQAKSIYFDGHHPVSNSMHRTNARFLKAYFFSRFCWFSRKSRWVLNTKYNPKGFQERVENGKKAGLNFLDFLTKNNVENKPVYLDIVSHSMGYAYSLGFMDVVQSHVKFGKMLTIAPESGGLEGRDWSLFKEVWQYGSNMDQPKGDVIYYQDGIAPQTAIKGLEQVPTEKGGRVFIPLAWPKIKKGFFRSHHLSFFQWFYLIKPGDRGYFQP